MVYSFTMRASELIEKLRTAIDKYGIDCEVGMVEHACFGSDRYGIGVGLVATQDSNTIKEFHDCNTAEEQKELIGKYMCPMMDAYFGTDGPFW